MAPSISDTPVMPLMSALKSANSLFLCTHIMPDGDAIGSLLAAGHMLEAMGKRVVLACADDVPRRFRCLPGWERIVKPTGLNPKDFDAALSLDCSDEGRSGACLEVYGKIPIRLQVDHHGTNPLYADQNEVDPTAPAAGILVARLAEGLGVPLNRDIAVCLYAAISTDTGNFSFDCTDAETFRVMSDLMEVGLPLAELNLKLFRERDPAQLRLLGRAIQGMWYEAEGRLAVMVLTWKDFEACGALSEHSDTLVNYGLETTGTEMALLARETEEGRIKFSLRARPPLRVDLIAARLGGGGHAQASGITMEGPIGAAVSRVIREMLQSLDGEKK